MFCSTCGTKVDDGIKFCPNCGATMNSGVDNAPQHDTQPNYTYGSQPQYNAQPNYEYGAQHQYNAQPQYGTQPQYNMQNPLMPQPSMKWFKFLIYFSLFFGAVINLAFGVNYITGNIYFVQSNGDVTAEMVYDFFGSEVQTLDIIYGVLCIAMAAFGIYTRFMLAKYKAIGPKCLYISYAAGAAISLFYAIALVAVTGESEVLSSSVFASLAVSIGFLFANKSYFDKRKHMFVN